MATKEEILDAISNMTVLELSELLSEFEERFGVTAAAPVAVAAAAPAAFGMVDSSTPSRPSSATALQGIVAAKLRGA